MDCAGTGGYADISPAAQVIVKDQSGAVIGTSALGPGELTFFEGVLRGCRYFFTVPDLPKAEFYSIEVGRRGGLTYSFEDLNTNGWLITLTLGP